MTSDLEFLFVFCRDADDAERFKVTDCLWTSANDDERFKVTDCLWTSANGDERFKFTGENQMMPSGLKLLIVFGRCI